MTILIGRLTLGVDKVKEIVGRAFRYGVSEVSVIARSHYIDINIDAFELGLRAGLLGGDGRL